MKYVFFCLTVLTIALIPSSKNETADAYSIALVRNVLATHSTGVITSWTQKNLPRLGDEVSIDILKIFSDRDLAQPRTVESFLPIIDEAFSEPQFISLDANKKPQITMLLLEHLLSRIADPVVRQQIKQTITYVKTQTDKLAANSKS
ncbi:MAG TPA: hypothetical protein VGR93_00365 [Candidatus Acidoferrales bacterium]|nr:hypothetical protein [Candidatus Acidoferrales bacterium]